MKNSLYNAISNIAQSFYDKIVEANVQKKLKSGIKTLILRRESGHCCNWCKRLAGEYTYSDAPKDVFRRHDNCDCLVTCKTERGTYQDVWSKEEYSTEREARMARAKETEDDQEFWRTNNQAKRRAKAEGQRCFNATEEWLHRSGIGSVVKNDKGVLFVDGEKLIIDGKINKYDPSTRELQVAGLIANKFGVRVEVNPKINNPKNFSLSDYFINSVRFDKKTPEGTSRHSLYGIVKKYEEQAHCFVIDLCNNTLSKEEAIRQINDDVFRSSHTRFVETIILVDIDDGIEVFERL